MVQPEPGSSDRDPDQQLRQKYSSGRTDGKAVLGSLAELSTDKVDRG